MLRKNPLHAADDRTAKLIGGTMPILRSLFLTFHSSSSATRRTGQRKQWVQSGLTVCLSLLFVLAVCLQPAGAQDTGGAIVGDVTDQSGAAIKTATVTVKDVDHGTSVSQQTNEYGAFDFPRLPVGKYEVSVTAAGFQTARQPQFELILNQ